MKQRYMVSACLVGRKCRYDGKSKLKKRVKEFLKDKDYFLFCPEQLGGLQIPRPPAEIVNGTGKDVIEGGAIVLNSEGKNVTENFLKGAEKSVLIAKKNMITLAVLKERSPSCGVRRIYNGKFNNETREGSGVTSALLESTGITLLSEDAL